jgi:hypothetical protein
VKVDRVSDASRPGEFAQSIKTMSLSESQQMPSLILHVSPGGLENGGGIGRMIGS